MEIMNNWVRPEPDFNTPYTAVFQESHFKLTAKQQKDIFDRSSKWLADPFLMTMYSNQDKPYVERVNAVIAILKCMSR